MPGAFEARLPEPGAMVTAMTYPSLEYNRQAQEVDGVLSTRPSPFGGPPQCWVDGVQVDPASVRAIPAGEGDADSRAVSPPATRSDTAGDAPYA
jgi:hypothetical protein